MARKKAKRKQSPWNKGRELGQRIPLRPGEVTRIKKTLAKKGNAGLRDLTLFSTALDSTLRARDLLALKVKDVRKRNRTMRDTIALTTIQGGQKIQCELSQTTTDDLEKWIDQTNKKPNHYLFTGRLGSGLRPMSPRQLSRLVKAWTEDIGLDPGPYGTASLRRTGAIALLKKTRNLENIQILLGHADIQTTERYLSPD